MLREASLRVRALRHNRRVEVHLLRRHPATEAHRRVGGQACLSHAVARQHIAERLTHPCTNRPQCGFFIAIS